MTKNDFLTQINFLDPTVYIMRGIPGSGKSTIAQEVSDKLYSSKYICSADNYWKLLNDTYQFDLKKVPQNHYWCLRQFVEHVGHYETNTIFLDNTNTTLDEFSHYVKIALAFSYKVKIITVCANPEMGIQRNIHKVPADTIYRMYYRMRDPQNMQEIQAFIKKNKIEHIVIDSESDTVL